MENKTLVSLIICTYNQKNSIVEAVESAINQTYSPLEIIVSDDASSDDTFDLVTNFISDYSGPHQIRLFKNSANLGIARHWDSVSRKANGSLIVHAAGDDISLPHRVEVIVKAWMTLNPRPVLLSSNGMLTTKFGKDLKPLMDVGLSNETQVQYGPINLDFDVLCVPVIGFSLAVDKRLYEAFPPLNLWMWSEDEILRSRAMIIGSIAFIPEILVRYRDGGISKGTLPSQEYYIKRYKEQSISRINYLLELLVDYTLVHGPSSKFISLYMQKINLAKEWHGLFQTKNILMASIIILKGLVSPVKQKLSKVDYITVFFVLFFSRLFFILRNLKYLK